jgi:plastocyanin
MTVTLVALTAFGVSAAAPGAASAATPAGAASAGNGAAPLVIGVDHADPANQNPAAGRLFEYTAFFNRDISVHSGAVVDFQAAPGSFHIVGLSSDERKARAVYPVAYPDGDDAKAPNGGVKVGFGPSNFPITGGSLQGGGHIDFTRPGGPPDCGVPQYSEATCVFKGGQDVEVAGPNPGFNPKTGAPSPVDWNISINAPVGTYAFFCFIHPGMSGTLHVVPAASPVTTQAEVNRRSARLFAADRAAALAKEAARNKVVWTGGAPGTRTYLFHVGAAAAGGAVTIDEMFPNTKTLKGHALSITRGDRVKFLLDDPHNVHTVFFHDTGNSPLDNARAPIGFDCGNSFQNPGPGQPCQEKGEGPGPELIGDPGSGPAGQLLQVPAPTTVAAIPDAGLLAGKDYNVPGSLNRWAVSTSEAATQPGIYTFHCTIHDWMHGSLNVG